MAWLSLVHCEMLDYACTAHFLLLKLTSSMCGFEKKSLVPCLILPISLDQKPVSKFV